MPDPAAYVAFIAAVLAMQITPGPDMMLVVSRGVGQGWRIAFCTVLGFMAAGAVQLPLLALGIASVVQSSPLAFDLLRWAGAAYLIWLGAKLLLGGRHRATAAGPAARRTSVLAAVREGMISNLINPKPLAFMLAFLPQFVDPSRGSVAVQLLLLGATQKVSGLLVQGSVALASGAVGGWLARRSGFVVWQERFAGAVMVALGLRLLFAGDGRTARA
jgi:threonine/homoserine/homoserine lactone efflux protein